MSKSAHLEKKVFLTGLVILISLLHPMYAHNTSWNKATITVKNTRLYLSVSILQVDLLGAVDPEKDSTIARSSQEWEELLPKVKGYAFKEINFTMNGRPAVNGIDGSWRLENFFAPDDENRDSLMGIIEITRSWPIPDSLIQLELRPDLLMNVDVPVKWVVIIQGDIVTKKKYHIIARGEAARYNFRKHTWVDSRGIPLLNESESSPWSTIVQFIQGLFSGLVK